MDVAALLLFMFNIARKLKKFNKTLIFHHHRQSKIKREQKRRKKTEKWIKFTAASSHPTAGIRNFYNRRSFDGDKAFNCNKHNYILFYGVACTLICFICHRNHTRRCFFPGRWHNAKAASSLWSLPQLKITFHSNLRRSERCEKNTNSSHLIFVIEHTLVTSFELIVALISDAS